MSSLSTLEQPASGEQQLDELLARIQARQTGAQPAPPPTPTPAPAPAAIAPAAPIAPAPTKDPLEREIDAAVDQAISTKSQAAAKPSPAISVEQLESQISQLLDQAQSDADARSLVPAVPKEEEPDDEPVAPAPVAVQAEAAPAPPVADHEEAESAPSSRLEARVSPEPSAKKVSPSAAAYGDDTPLGDDTDSSASPSANFTEEPTDIHQLDEFLAEEEIEGDFESVDVVVHGHELSEPPTPTDSQPKKTKPRVAGPRITLPQIKLPKLGSIDAEKVIAFISTALIVMNMPLKRLPDWARQTVGYAGLLTIFNATLLLLYAAIF